MWEPIAKGAFENYLQEQVASLNTEELRDFELHRVPLSTCRIKRSEDSGFEDVFDVARNERGVMYFDDVEFGFNVSPTDENNVITNPGASQFDLSDAIRAWLI